MNILATSVDRPGATANIGRKALPPRFHLPLVSVIVINENHHRYLAEAVESVFAQTYSNVECIVVDNTSSDDASDVLAALAECHPDVKVLRRNRNDGQTAAFLDGLDKSSGPYVIFLEADDALMPLCIETHIYVHLSSRVHIGFTAGDMLQAVDGDIVVGTGEAMNSHLRHARGRRQSVWRPYRYECGWPSPRVNGNLNAKACYVPPLRTHWIWSPMSGHCYRRDALALFADNKHLLSLWTATGAYFSLGISGWCGSVLIDEPVFVRRKNAAKIQLHHMPNDEPDEGGPYHDKARALIVDQLMRHYARFSRKGLFKIHVILLLLGLDVAEVDRNLPRWAKRSCVGHRLVMHFNEFAREFGRMTTCLLMLLFGVPIAVIWHCCRNRASRATE